MSYPCLEYQGHKFSLIKPYTIDDKIITGLSVEMSMSHNDYTCIFTVYENEYYEINYNSWYSGRLEEEIRNELRHHMYSRDTNTNVRDMCDQVLYDATMENTFTPIFAAICKKICKQIERINSDSNAIYELMNTLMEQERLCNEYRQPRYYFSTARG